MIDAVSLVKLIIYFLITLYFIYLFIMPRSEVQIEGIDLLMRRNQMLPYWFFLSSHRDFRTMTSPFRTASSSPRPLASRSSSTPRRRENCGSRTKRPTMSCRFAFVSFDCAFTRVVVPPGQFAGCFQGQLAKAEACLLF